MHPKFSYFKGKVQIFSVALLIFHSKKNKENIHIFHKNLVLKYMPYIYSLIYLVGNKKTTNLTSTKMGIII